MGALGETEAVILELSHDRSEQRLFNEYRTTLKITETLANFFLECDVLTSHTEDVPIDYPITPSRT